ncbi:hypothetical protein BZG36_00971 [Bifiguratus adelaidae]|uniref:Uncharacterized protein n=1 Tax=Bifiguratus adelaidae TaxID=1938954 RepID=A0A261Y6I7_9FUNG|nr:hypothetical protein BZG36_00971 [Bifiguratus adelaidae]
MAYPIWALSSRNERVKDLQNITDDLSGITRKLLAAPLTNMTRQRVPYQLSRECEVAVEALKCAIC